MWVFGYGSLMSDGWERDRGCTRRALADIHGYRRIFNKKSTVNWGTRENPCPTLNLVEAAGGRCRGVAFEFPDDFRSKILDYLSKREGKDFHLCTVEATLVEGDVISVTVPIYRGRNIIPSENVEEIVPLLMRANGRDGSGIDYLDRVAKELARSNIKDEVVEQLQHVAGLFAIRGDDLWVKVVEMLQQNWAAIETGQAPVRVHFISDNGVVFDKMDFGSKAEAVTGLTRNGFRRFADAPDLHSFLRAPEPPFRPGHHPNGLIYSSGRYWR
jgi:cation transport protein ChaC